MASRLIALVALYGILIQTAYSQCVNRGLPTIGPNFVEPIVPNPFLCREPGLPILPPPCAGPLIPPCYQNPIMYKEPVLPILPSPCGGPIFPPIYENPIIYSEPILPILPSPCAGPIVSPIYESISEVISEVGYPRIIQDSTVANSLANALQLLIVSNLLSTTLPGPREIPVCPYEFMGMPAFR